MSDSESKDDDKEDDDEFEDYPPIIIDNGGGSMKSGLSSLTNDFPESILSTIVGHSIINDSSEYSSTYVGEEAILKGSKKLSFSRPIKSGLITNWEDMTTIWKYIFEKELKCLEDVEDSTVILSETPLNPRFHREKTLQIMFETFDVSSYYTQNNAVFELYSHGQTTGMVIGVGFDTCYSCPIYQGYALSHATKRMDIGGNTVNEQLCKLLQTSGYDLDHIENKSEIVEDIKKKKCFVARDYWSEMKKRDSLIWKNDHDIDIAKYSLPDGTELILGNNTLFESSEIFFKPKLIGGHHAMKHKSICQYAYDSLLSVNIDVRKEIASNICIAGGGTFLNGFVERFTKDINNTVPQSMRLKIQCKKNRYNATYIGASILSTLDFFKETVISCEEYEESGPKIVHRKCF